MSAAAGKNGAKLHGPKPASAAQKAGDSSPAPAMFRREDWTEFRDPNRISNKAGVPFADLPRVVVKELADNALDVSDAVEFGILDAGPGAVTFFVADAGPGPDGTDGEIADLYSIRRPLASSKTVRLPTRGMLGNGLRVVAGVVLVAGGRLRVGTRGRMLTLEPRAEDGRTTVISAKPWAGVGTRIEVTLRGELAGHAQAGSGEELFVWAEEARRLTGGSRYKGKSSAWWYDPAGFWELCRAAGVVRVETFVGRTLDGCSDKAAAAAGGLAGRSCDTLTLVEAEAILGRARVASRPVAPERLGKVGRRADYFGYAYESGTFEVQGATIPFVVEAWANRACEPGGMICVNRTPVCTAVTVRRDGGSNYAIFGCQLRHQFTAGRKDAGEFRVLVNVIAPFVPLTSSGKDPDLSPVRTQVLEALEKAVRVTKRTAPKALGQTPTQKGVIRGRIGAAAVKLSGGGTYQFSLRQLFYELRPALIEAIGREPNYGTFGRIVGEFEDAKGDIENLYRDDRGSLYHPHTGEIIPLGTRSVAGYRRPVFGFRSLLFCEKEGLFPMLRHARWPERFDCALCSSKGFATRAARDLIRLLKESPEPLTVFVIHDADGPGTLIFETLRAGLAGRGIEVVNLGLDPAEGRAMGLASEPVRRKKNKRVPVASYVPEADRDWLQEHRIELNAMTTPQFIEWLTGKVTSYHASRKQLPKVIPPADVLRDRLERETRAALERRITAEVLRAAGIPGRVEAAFAEATRRIAARARTLASGLRKQFGNTPDEHWTAIVEADAGRIAEGR